MTSYNCNDPRTQIGSLSEVPRQHEYLKDAVQPSTEGKFYLFSPKKLITNFLSQKELTSEWREAHNEQRILLKGNQALAGGSVGGSVPVTVPKRQVQVVFWLEGQARTLILLRKYSVGAH